MFCNKVVLVTGHTGFKGSWLSIWLEYLGAKVVGLSFNVPTHPSNFDASNVGNLVKEYLIDIRDRHAVQSAIEECQPDFIFHLAAQSLVGASYDFPLETIQTNAMGSANILESLRFVDKEIVVIMITSDKVYDNVEWAWGYRETDRLGGKDPYSASKGMAELAIKGYIESFFNKKDSNIRVGVARAGNVIGGGDWSKNRVVPDCITAWSNNETLYIRNPNATRPWQHVLEPLNGYLQLAANLKISNDFHGNSYNFGPFLNQNYSVGELVQEMAKYWNNAKWKCVPKINKPLNEAELLRLNCDKAMFDLNWSPILQFEESVKMTVEWYKIFYQGRPNSMMDFTLSQVVDYMNLAKL